MSLDVDLTRGQQTPTRKPKEQAKKREITAQAPQAQKRKQAPRAQKRRVTAQALPGVMCDGVFLPPRSLRPTRKGKRSSHQEYLDATRYEVDWMVDNLGLSTQSSVLDVGCGSGRIALGILDRVGEIHKYRGLDVKQRFLEWARQHISREHPSFQFLRVDVQNDMYNPKGATISPDFAFPFREHEFDIICLFSVFTHMLSEDVRIYLRELHRVLKDDGKVFLTANVEEDVPDVQANPIGYKGRHSYTHDLQSVRYNREFFEGLIDEGAFHLEGYHPEVRKGQHCLLLAKKQSQGVTVP